MVRESTRFLQRLSTLGHDVGRQAPPPLALQVLNRRGGPRGVPLCDRPLHASEMGKGTDTAARGGVMQSAASALYRNTHTYTRRHARVTAGATLAGPNLRACVCRCACSGCPLSKTHTPCMRLGRGRPPLLTNGLTRRPVLLACVVVLVEVSVGETKRRERSGTRTAGRRNERRGRQRGEAATHPIRPPPPPSSQPRVKSRRTPASEA